MNSSKSIKTAEQLLKHGRIGFAASLGVAKALHATSRLLAQARDRILFESVYHEVHQSSVDFSRSEQLRGAYKGESLYILCTGASLSYEDISRLKTQHTLAVNGFVHAYGDQFEPTFYAMTDGAFYRKGSESFFHKLYEKFPSTLFFTPHYAHDFMNEHVLEEHAEVRDRIVYVPTFFNHNVPSLGQYDAGYYRSPELHRQVIKSGNILLFSLLVAIELGFEHIYIMGADHDLLSHNPNGALEWSHCYEVETVPDLDTHRRTYTDKMKYMLSVYLHHQRVRRTAEERGQTIYNATRGTSFLDVYPLVHTDRLLSNLPS